MDCVFTANHSMVLQTDIKDNKRVNLEVTSFAARTRKVCLTVFQNDAYRQEKRFFTYFTEYHHVGIPVR